MTDAESKLDLLMGLFVPCLPLLAGPWLPEQLFGPMPTSVHNIMLAVQVAAIVGYGLLVLMLLPGIISGWGEAKEMRRHRQVMAQAARGAQETVRRDEA